MEFQIVCLASQDWNSHLGVPQQIMARVAERHRVLYVDPPRSLTSRFRPWAVKADGRLRHMELAFAPRVVRRVPPARSLPMHALPPALAKALQIWNGYGLKSWFRAEMTAQAIRRPVYWVFEPASIQHLPHLPLGPVIYDCIDYWAGYFAPGSHRHATIDAMDAAMARRADLVFVASEKVMALHGPRNANTHLIPHAADFAHFNAATAPGAPMIRPPGALPGQKIIGLCGILDKRVDAQSLALIAQRRPDWHFALVGPVQTNLDTSALCALENVSLPGMSEVADMPAHIKGFDVCLIPYLIDDFVRGIYPLKLHEYLAAGKPVVSTPVPAVLPHGDIVHIGEGADGLEAAIQAALNDTDPNRVAARSALARQNSWEARVADKMTLISRLVRHAGPKG